MPVRTFVFGSCVTRDTFEFLDPERYRLAGYVARQSWASVAHPAGPVLDVETLPSPFHRRMVTGALDGDAIQRLDAVGRVDLVLVDLTDERLGLYVRADGGMVTRSVELVASGLEAGLAETARFVPFGSRAHVQAWRSGARQVLTALASRSLLERTLVVAPDWAATSSAGDRGLTSAGVSPRRFARLARPYYRTLRAALGSDRLLGTDLPVQADPSHQWGLAPFHYAEGVYRGLVAQIDAATASLLP